MEKGTLWIIGTPMSPYVRKVMVLLDFKKIRYVNDPIVGFFGNDDFRALSPLARIPLLLLPKEEGETNSNLLADQHNGLADQSNISPIVRSLFEKYHVLTDSSVICQFIEEKFPSSFSLLPKNLILRAKVRWLEEYADTRLADVMIWGIFNISSIQRILFNKPFDHQRMNELLERDVPQCLGYLNNNIPYKSYILGKSDGDISIADIAIAATLYNPLQTKYFTIEGHLSKYPNVLAHYELVMSRDEVKKSLEASNAVLKFPPPIHREKLEKINWNLSSHSFMQSTPRMGIMKI